MANIINETSITLMVGNSTQLTLTNSVAQASTYITITAQNTAYFNVSSNLVITGLEPCQNQPLVLAVIDNKTNEQLLTQTLSVTILSINDIINTTPQGLTLTDQFKDDIQYIRNLLDWVDATDTNRPIKQVETNVDELFYLQKIKNKEYFIYDTNTIYSLDEIVFYNNNFYASLIDNNSTPPTTTNWKLVYNFLPQERLYYSTGQQVKTPMSNSRNLLKTTTNPNIALFEIQQDTQFTTPLDILITKGNNYIYFSAQLSVLDNLLQIDCHSLIATNKIDLTQNLNLKTGRYGIALTTQELQDNSLMIGLLVENPNLQEFTYEILGTYLTAPLLGNFTPQETDIIYKLRPNMRLDNSQQETYLSLTQLDANELWELGIIDNPQQIDNLLAYTITF